MNPESPGADPLAAAIYERVRVIVALNKYSRQDVKGALRVVAKSIDMHTRDGGPNGYLNFVREFIKGG